jgi:hypothetical protein
LREALPLVKPDVQISRIRLSCKLSAFNSYEFVFKRINPILPNVS